MVEGLQPTDPQGDKMGVFELMLTAALPRRPVVVNGRPAWEVVGNDPGRRHLYFAADGRWWVGSELSMRAGSASGWLCTVEEEAAALTPDQASSGWQACIGKWAISTEVAGSWRAVPNVRVLRVDEVRQQATATGPIVMGCSQPTLGSTGLGLGVYELTQHGLAGSTALVMLNGRAVYQCEVANGERCFLYFGGCVWLVCTAGPPASEPRGAFGCAEAQRVLAGRIIARTAAAELDALTPDQVQGDWEMLKSNHWVVAQSLFTRQVSGAWLVQGALTTAV